MWVKECDICGIKFEIRQKTVRYCCPEHGNIAKNKVRMGEEIGFHTPIQGEMTQEERDLAEEQRKKMQIEIEQNRAKSERNIGRYSRPCHDCKRPTTDYRCPKCLKLWRIKHGISPDARDGGYL